MSPNLLLAMLAGFSLSFAYPPFKFAQAALVGLVPFFYLLEKTNLAAGIGWAALIGFLVSLSSLQLATLSTLWEALAVLVLSPLYLALYAAVHQLALRKLGKHFLILIPVLWAVKEVAQLVGQVGFASTTLGSTQAEYFLLFPPRSAVAAAVLGVWVVSINVALFAFLKNLSNARVALGSLAVAVLMFFAPQFFGQGTPATYDSTILVKRTQTVYGTFQ